VQPGGNARGYWVVFLFERRITVYRFEPSPYSHHLQEFLTSLKQERGFADATIINREHSLRTFLAWLVAQDVPLSRVSAVVITKYFASAVAGRWKRTTISFHVYSLCSFFRFATS
jgi:site-specific recombinase XerD